MSCSECKGTGFYIGIFEWSQPEPCRSCPRGGKNLDKGVERFFLDDQVMFTKDVDIEYCVTEYACRKPLFWKCRKGAFAEFIGLENRHESDASKDRLLVHIIGPDKLTYAVHVRRDEITRV